jgi:type II secretory pathway component PulJ
MNVQGFVSPRNHDASEQQSGEGDRVLYGLQTRMLEPRDVRQQTDRNQNGGAPVGWSRTVGPAADRFGRIQGCSTRGELAY